MSAENWEEASRWLRYAREDLATARILLRDECTPRHICLLAQQSAEKTLKSVFVFLQDDFPRSHDLELLINLIPEGWEVKISQVDLATLSEWAVESRYPGDWPEATPYDAKVAVETAETVYRVVVSDYAYKGFSPA
jgi:HEPN domain-containing protein